MLKVKIVQPYLTKYRIPVFKHLAQSFDVSLFASQSRDYGSSIQDSSIQIDVVKEKKILNLLYWQSGLVKTVLSSKLDVLFITANPRYLSTWLALMAAKIKGIKVILHGQGLYKKENVSYSNKTTYFLYNLFCDQYIAYTQLSKDSLISLPINKKTSVAENSIVNQHPVSEKNGNETGILFIGRLRNGSNIEMLIQSCIELNKKVDHSEKRIQLHIIGGGDILITLKKQFSEFKYIHFWGEIYDNKKISKISKLCFAGCYPGDAGLSVLHYMSLSLPPIVHSSMSKHMGPEPSYVKDDFNGIYFERDDLASLKCAIYSLIHDRTVLVELQKNAFSDYATIVNPPLSERIESIISKVLEQ